MQNIWKFKKYDSLSLAFKLKEVIPEFKNTTSEEIEDYIRTLEHGGLMFIKKEKVKTNFYWRLTLPFLFIISLLMIINLPINFIITGRWYYKVLWIKNWFQKLNIFNNQ